MATVVMRFDFRCPPGNAVAADELYHAALEMAAYSDGRGVDVIGLSEHHNTDDGYLSAPLTVATAMAARTSRVVSGWRRARMDNHGNRTRPFHRCQAQIPAR